MRIYIYILAYINIIKVINYYIILMKNYINKYDLFIFNLNNAIVNVEEYHYKAWVKTLQEKLLERSNNNFIENYFTFEYFCEIFQDFSNI